MRIPSAVIRAAGSFAIALSVTSSAAAQEPRSAGPGRFEIRVPSGGFIAIGAQGDQIKNAHVTAFQMSWLVRSHLAITGTFAWARSRDLATTGNPKVNVFTSDVGSRRGPGNSRSGKAFRSARSPESAPARGATIT